MASKRIDTLFKGGGIDRIRRIFPDDDQATVERPVHDSVAQEPARLSGTPFKIYSLRRAKNHHPLYREPSAQSKDWEFLGPWEMMATWEPDETDYSATTEGLTKTSTGILWVARKEFEDAGTPDPKIGDVIDLWTVKPFDGVAKPRYWNIIKASAEGHIQSSETFTMWKIALESRSEFRPERMVENTRI